MSNELRAELVRPQRLNQYGTIWEAGKPLRVTLDLALVLQKNPRFIVHGLPTDPPLHTKNKPKGAALFQAIISAAGNLDREDPTCWTQSGEPNYRALPELLGYDVSLSDYQRALAYENGEGVEAARAESMAADMLPVRGVNPDRGDMTTSDVLHPPVRRNVKLIKRNRTAIQKAKDEANARIHAAKMGKDVARVQDRVVGLPGQHPEAPGVRISAAELQAQSLAEDPDGVPDIPVAVRPAGGVVIVGGVLEGEAGAAEVGADAGEEGVDI